MAELSQRKLKELREENPALAQIYGFMDIDFKREGFKYEILDLIKIREDLKHEEVYGGYRWLDGYLDKGGVYKIIKIHEKEKVYVVEDEQKILYSVTESMIDQEGTDNL